MSSAMSLPQFNSLRSLPASHADFVSYIAKNPQTPIHNLLKPFNAHDAELRRFFAQQQEHPAVSQPNIVPVFNGLESNIKIRARDLTSESDQECQSYLMPLTKDDRKSNGSPAIVQSLKEFQKNFAVFSESSLSEMDWSNVVVAGSAALTPLLPVPNEFSGSKRSLRQYYHEKVAPASDVDLFLYGLTEQQAKEKIIKIEQHVRDSILSETTTVRTKNAITIVSEYPTRHVQIVLRVYRSISEILTGFDVDCSCIAYDGRQVWASPRALAACMTQINQVDLSRRSPSYENRLFKYSRRGFEIFWPLLDRERVNPTIFERNFQRVVGLARLLVLEKLPEKKDREAYTEQRRLERGRPPSSSYAGNAYFSRGDIKAEHEYEIADWLHEDDVSDYHTFTVPYGPKYYARKIEKLLYKKDLLLNAEWNKSKDREVNLHRHPAFFGNAEDVMHDCCGYCPQPLNGDEEKIAKEEAKRFVSGEIEFIKDNPGRQTIGSFNPITDTEWTEMAYIANTESLFAAIVDQDLDRVQNLLSQEDSDPNHRDWTGRTPLHLAVTCSSLDIVQCLIDRGARLVSRLADGKTALHIAAMRGSIEIVSALLQKSEVNEENERIKKQELSSENQQGVIPDDAAASGLQDDNSGFDIVTPEDDGNQTDMTTQGSYIKIEPTNQDTDCPEDVEENEPDIYDINVYAWDVPVTPLHLAILNGHLDVVRLLVDDFGANVLLPVKLTGHNKSPRASILPLVIASMLPLQKANDMVELLLNLGCSAAQADLDSITALHYIAIKETEILDCLLASDKPGVSRAIHHMPAFGYSFMDANVATPLTSAILQGRQDSALHLLEAGARPDIDLNAFTKSTKQKFGQTYNFQESLEKNFNKNCKPPIILAAEQELPQLIPRLLDMGADLHRIMSWEEGYGNNARLCQKSVLDSVRNKILTLKQHLSVEDDTYDPPLSLEKAKQYLDDLDPDTYTYWSIQGQLECAKLFLDDCKKDHEDRTKKRNAERSVLKDQAVKTTLEEFLSLETKLVEQGAESFSELHPSDGSKPSGTKYPQTYFRRRDLEQAAQWTPLPSFSTNDSLGGREKAYTKLFQSCWTGDLDTIRELTTAIWDENNAPLKIAVSDRNGFSTFDIAVLRGHLQAAKLILEISLEQYRFKQRAQKDNSTRRAADDDNSEDSDGSDDGINILTEVIDDRFTVDDVGVVPTQAEGDISPIRLLSMSCPAPLLIDSLKPYIKDAATIHSLQGPIRYARVHHSGDEVIRMPDNLFQVAIFNDDMQLLSFLLDMGIQYACSDSELGPKNANEPRLFQFQQGDLEFAISLGRTHMLSEILRHTGAGLPLDALAQTTQVGHEKILEKPKYYQGLSVHGKKREDWARAGRESRIPLPYEHAPLLLLAARLGNLESVKWCSGNSPTQCYLEYVTKNQQDIRLRSLATSDIGAQKTIEDCLRTNQHLLAHCAVMGHSASNLDVLRYVVQEDPSLVYKKSQSGHTPLHLAFSLHRTQSKIGAIKFLIKSGSDQKTRDRAGNNIIHSLLRYNYYRRKLSATDLVKLLGLLDYSVLQDLLIQKSAQSPGSATPLACYLHVEEQTDKKEEIVAVILSFSKGRELDIVNGEGDTPLHTETRRSHSKVVDRMLQQRSDLLWRENAVGRTPYEVARDTYMAHLLSNPPNIPGVGRNHYRHTVNNSVLSKPVNYFEDPIAFANASKVPAEQTWDVCIQFSGRENSLKRKLVSLLEANEVAKRLALDNGKRTKAAQRDAEEGDGVIRDQVDSWFKAIHYC